MVNLKFGPSERVSAFDIKIVGGQILALPQVPVGWVINISNDPSWPAEISGRAIGGAAFVRPEDFVDHMLSVGTLSNGVTEAARAANTTKVSGFIELYKIDETRRVKLSNADFLMSQRQQP